MTQASFGHLVGVTQQACSGLTGRGVLVPGQSAGEWLRAYCAGLREQAAGRSSEAGGLDLVQERAALAREQRVRLEMLNATTRGEYAPIDLLGDALAKAIEVMVSELDQVDGMISKTTPDLPEHTRLAVLNCITAARNKIATRGTQLVMAAIDPDDDVDAEGGQDDDE